MPVLIYTYCNSFEKNLSKAESLVIGMSVLHCCALLMLHAVWQVNVLIFKARHILISYDLECVTCTEGLTDG